MGIKVIAANKRAYFEYEILETLEAGISLTGGEVKSLRAGHGSLNESFCFARGGEVFLKNCLIPAYRMSTQYNLDERRDRRLLLHKREIERLDSKLHEKGLTLVPLKLYLKGRLLKLEVALCKGKHTYDKKRTIKERDLNRDMQREIKNYK